MDVRIRRLWTPGANPPGVVEAASVIAMVAICALDVWTGSDVRLHPLYVFPLAATAFHSPRLRAVVLMAALSAGLQLATAYAYDTPGITKITDMLVALASSTLTAILARYTRDSLLIATQLSTTDPLTGLPNRRLFDSVTDLEIARQRRYGGIFSIALLDLDRFKSLNDSRGHSHGDRALVLVAHVIRGQIRESDTAARIGGDEFVILMPDTDKADCEALCVRLAEELSRQLTAGGLPFSASIGSSTFVQPPASSADAVDQADRAMYVAKSRRVGAA